MRAFRVRDQESPRALWLWLRHEERYYGHVLRMLRRQIAEGWPDGSVMATASLMLATAALGDSIRARLWPVPNQRFALYHSSSTRREAWQRLLTEREPVSFEAAH
jgi:hypothetical protein